jgi:hypothetical protein
MVVNGRIQSRADTMGLEDVSDTQAQMCEQGQMMLIHGANNTTVDYFMTVLTPSKLSGKKRSGLIVIYNSYGGNSRLDSFPEPA